MDVWDSTAAAREAAEREAGFFSCDGPREPVTDLDDGADDFAGGDVVQEARQRRLPRHGLRSRRPVTRNLTVAAATRGLTVAGLLAVWQSLSAASDQVVADLD